MGFESQNQPPEIVKDIDKWIPDQIEQALNEVERVEKNDGAVLVVVAKKFANMITVNR